MRQTCCAVNFSGVWAEQHRRAFRGEALGACYLPSVIEARSGGTAQGTCSLLNCYAHDVQLNADLRTPHHGTRRHQESVHRWFGR